MLNSGFDPNTSIAVAIVIGREIFPIRFCHSCNRASWFGNRILYANNHVVSCCCPNITLMNLFDRTYIVFWAGVILAVLGRVIPGIGEDDNKN